MARNNKSKLAFGALLAGLTGFVTGILFAPKSGQETRGEIKQAAHKASDTITQKAKQAQTHLAQLITKAEAQLTQTKAATSDQGRKLVSQAKRTKTQVGTVAKAVKAGKASDKDLDAAVKKAKAAISSLKTYLKK